MTDRLRHVWAEDDRIAGGCPDDARIFDAATGAAAPGEVEAIVDHLAVCGACATSWRLARAMTGGAGIAEERELPPANGTRWLAVGALVATLAAGAVAVIGVEVEPPVYRDAPSVAVTSPMSHVTMRASGAPPELRWEASDDGATYVVRIATAELDVLAVSPWLEDARWTPPADALADVPAGTRLRWQVEAAWPDGRVARSPSWVITVE